MRDEFVLGCLRRDAEWLAEKSQTAKDASDYGVYVDVFVAMAMSHLGYARKKDRTIEEILDRKEVWRRMEE